MQTAEFQALALVNEINLNKIAAHFGLAKRLRWEDPLILREDNLQGILNAPESKSVYLYSFGSLVCINCSHHEITDLLTYLKKIEPVLGITSPFTYFDDYRLEINPEVKPAIENDFMTVPENKSYLEEILALVLAKSTALERIEAAVALLLDQTESKIEILEKGRLNMSTRGLAKISAQVLRFKYHTIAYLMLLDKPEITWTDDDSQSLYTQMSRLFELDERYELIQQKSDILMDIIEVFSTLTQANRGNYLEWLIIILIIIEIFIYLFEIIY